jgi:hypothetical protein
MNAIEKTNTLKQALLERRESNEDLETDPLTIPSVPQRQLPWQCHVSHEEIAAATIQVKSTSPGTDGISVRLLKACWSVIRDPVQ